MILQRLILHNYGPYYGRHEVDLEPKSAKRPVVLFGGMNGGGKTSILNALQLCLFGRQSSLWSGTEGTYEEYLGKCINRQADADEGAGIELLFRVSRDGAEQLISVNRYWRRKGDKVRESLDVLRDGKLDTVLAESWAESVEEILPARVAPLFFFDGEKIEELAKPEKSAEILRAAIHSLLGLDIVDQLQVDLEILERKKRKEVSGDAQDAQLARKEQDLERDLARCTETVSSLHQDAAGLQNEIDRLAKAHKELEAKLIAEGGAVFEGRHQLESERSVLKSEIERLEEEVRANCDGALPLCLVAPMLTRMAGEAESHSGAGDGKRLLPVLAARDNKLIELLAAWQVPASAIKKVAGHLEQDRNDRQVQGSSLTPVLEDRLLGKLQVLQESTLPALVVGVSKLLDGIDGLELKLQGVERKLAGLPDEERIVPMLRERDEMRAALDARTRDRDIKQELLKAARQEEESVRKDLDGLRQRMAEDVLGHEDVTRMLKHSAKARNTLIRFRQKILATHVAKIEQLALESFVALMRKKRLIKDLRIDPVSFAVTLQDDGGRHILPDRLSAGERQLLAVALLWGLCRSSGRPIPTVIDTPLGRLDSKHRSNVVERYFPFASHQVILLSTDEEIDERYLPTLKQHLSHTYLVENDDASHGSRIREGYFWEVPA